MAQPVLPPAIRFENLSKTYKTGFWFKPKLTPALKSLTLDVHSHQAFGLLGLNGAGKTTTLKVLLGFVYPDAGRVEILGGRISDRRVRAQIGYLSELPYFSKQHSGRELLSYFGALHGLSGKALAARVDEVLELVRMTKPAGERLAGYSKGMLQRIGIGQALIGKPKLLICDEPMSGLDPVGYKEMRDIFLDLKKAGTTLFLNTHILDEVERVCDRIGIMHEGVLRDVAPIAQVLASKVPVDYWIDVDKSQAGKLAKTPFQASIKAHGGFQIHGNQLNPTLAKLQSKRVKIGAVRPLASVVEAYFLKTIGMTAKFDPAKGAA
ncbi:MAG TPA: ABC transporter ATP-binding protein [bacterium]|nr:ABC transporter ATP-binding protein [bacterium]